MCVQKEYFFHILPSSDLLKISHSFPDYPNPTSSFVPNLEYAYVSLHYLWQFLAEGQPLVNDNKY